jgi:hypothetical protein
VTDTVINIESKMYYVKYNKYCSGSLLF